MAIASPAPSQIRLASFAAAPFSAQGLEMVAAVSWGGASDDRRKTRLAPGLDEKEPVERSSESSAMTVGPGVTAPSSPPQVGPIAYEE